MTVPVWYTLHLVGPDAGEIFHRPFTCNNETDAITFAQSVATLIGRKVRLLGGHNARETNANLIYNAGTQGTTVSCPAGVTLV
jgi:hypothetical protein